MSLNVNYYEKERLESTVRSLCPIIKRQVHSGNLGAAWDDSKIRHELVTCILSSQVRYEMADSAAERLDKAGLLDECWWNGKAGRFESRVIKVLLGRTSKSQDHWRYRFPRARARNIAEAREFLAKNSICDRLLDGSDPKEKRRWLVAHISGIGPKQASMFLRNSGVSYDLAILDKHVLRYLEIQHLLSPRPAILSNIKTYELIEQIIISYAESLGYPVGYLDWAIWATMQAAKEVGL